MIRMGSPARPRAIAYLATLQSCTRPYSHRSESGNADRHDKAAVFVQSHTRHCRAGPDELRRK